MRHFCTHHQERQHAQGRFQSSTVDVGQGSPTTRFTGQLGLLTLERDATTEFDEYANLLA